MQEKTPGKTKKQEIFITFLQMWTIFPQNPGKLTEKRESSRPPEIRRPAAFGERKKKRKREGFLLVPPWRMAFSVSPKVKNNLEKF